MLASVKINFRNLNPPHESKVQSDMKDFQLEMTVKRTTMSSLALSSKPIYDQSDITTAGADKRNILSFQATSYAADSLWAPASWRNECVTNFLNTAEELCAIRSIVLYHVCFSSHGG